MKAQGGFGEVRFGYEFGAQQRHHEDAANKNQQCHAQGEQFVQQGPAQHHLVGVCQGLGGLVKPAGDATDGFVIGRAGPRLGARAMRQHAGVMPDAGHHWVKGKAHEHRDQHGGHDGDAKLVKKLADDAPHKSDGQKNRHDGQGGGHHRQANLLGAIERGLVGALAHLHVAHDVFPHHDRIINQQAHAQAQGHQGDHVDGETGHVHEQERANQGDWQGQAGDHRGAPRVEKQKHDEHGQQRTFNQCAAHVVYRDPDLTRAVRDLLEPHAWRQLVFHGGHGFDQTVDHGDGVFVLGLLHIEQQGALAVVQRQAFCLLGVVTDPGQLLDAYRCAALARHDDAAEVLWTLQPPGNLYHALLLA